uniref:Uncharacterized protein n=1 Tax=Timema tahoe TaxID=61484 RepID=A0A7R9P083_9NEOP|nr:unnamed protein product [Timema tahoe]
MGEVHKVLLGVLLLATCLGAVEVEENPFLEAARTLLQDQLQGRGGGGGGVAQGLGGLVQGFLQSDGGRHLGDMLMGGGKPGAGGGGNPAADILSGIGSLIASTGANNQGGGGGGGIDPQLIGQMMSMFAGGGVSDEDGDNSVDINNNEVGAGNGKRKPAAPGVDWESMLSLASTFMGAGGGQQRGGGGGGMEGLLNLLPVLLQSVGGNSGDQRQQPARERRNSAASGGGGSPFVPPFLSGLYEYWDHFRRSELGQTLWKSSGMEATLQLFTDKEGNFQVTRIFSSLENHSFRRRWIKSLTSFVAEWVAHVSDPNTQTRYISTAQFMANNFLKAQGYHKGALFDPIRPAESLSHLTNAVFKRQFGLKVNSATYIKPAVTYIQEVFQLGQSKGLSLSHLKSQEIESKLADTLNGEVIEPVLRVWRAYRYSVQNPQCDRYLVCALNRHESTTVHTAGLKPGVTKLASIVSSWFLSGETGTPFWKLYNAATEEHNCQVRREGLAKPFSGYDWRQRFDVNQEMVGRDFPWARLRRHVSEDAQRYLGLNLCRVKYPADCSDFHELDVKATTEYAHSEL